MKSSPSHLSHPKYRADIDGLRAVAVLSVVAFHAFPGWIKGGFIGVDVFFVISGYLISTIIFENLERGTFSFAEFYARRIKRIFPALVLVLVASYVFGWFALLADEYRQLGKHIAAGAGFVSNIVLSSEAGYFDNSAETKPLLHLWSLGIEEQFYILWPLLLWLSWKRNFNLPTIIIAVAVISFYLNVTGIEKNAAATFYSPQTRFWELLTGSLLAWTTLHRAKALPGVTPGILGWPASRAVRKMAMYDANAFANVRSCVGLALLCYGFWRISQDYRFPGIWAVIPVGGALLVISAGPKAWVNQFILSNKVLVWFGLISYPLYLWHWPLLSLTRIADSESPPLWLRMAIVAASVMLAWFTYRFIERPVRTERNSKRKAWTLALSMVVIAAVGKTTADSHGFPWRASLVAVQVEQEAMGGYGEDDPSTHSACMNMYGLTGPIRYCNLSGPGKPHIALIGDSHARALYEGLKEELKLRGEGLLNIGGRLFLDMAVYPLGDQFEIDAYKGGIQATRFVAQEPSIDTVVMVSLGPLMLKLSDAYVFELISRPEIKDRKAVWDQAMRETLDLMVAHKKRVIFVVDDPNIDFDPRSCFDGRPLRIHSTVRSPCAISRAAFDTEAREYRSLVFSVLRDYPQVAVFDAPAYLCDEIWCWARKDGKPLYLDSNHMSLAGARLLSKELVKVIDGQEAKNLKP